MKLLEWKAIRQFVKVVIVGKSYLVLKLIEDLDHWAGIRE